MAAPGMKSNEEITRLTVIRCNNSYRMPRLSSSVCQRSAVALLPAFEPGLAGVIMMIFIELFGIRSRFQGPD